MACPRPGAHAKIVRAPKSVQSKDCYGTLCYSYEYMHGEEK